MLSLLFKHPISISLYALYSICWAIGMYSVYNFHQQEYPSVATGGESIALVSLFNTLFAAILGVAMLVKYSSQSNGKPFYGYLAILITLQAVIFLEI
jgi:hypothetical protein